jgi:uncharacterized membrane protein YraQ (UPF0718 family)
MLASPCLNPAAIALTFGLFSLKVAVARVLMAIVTISFGGLVIEHLFVCTDPIVLRRSLSDHKIPIGWQEAAWVFFRSLLHVTLRTVPVLCLGVFGSMLVTQYLPRELFVSNNSFRYLVVIATASLAVPLAMPTFFEIPLALGLLAAGAPVGAAAAFLFAGPAINLPSLLALARWTDWRIATTLAVFVGVVAIVGGLLLL